MGWIAKLKSFRRSQRNGAYVSDAKVDLGGSYSITPEHFSAPGDDSYPLPGDYVASVPVEQTGRAVAVGYLDPANAPQAAVGEKRIYSRNSDGDVVAEVWLLNTGEVRVVNENGQVTLGPDGSILGDNGLGTFELEAGGDFVVNGVTIAANGDVTIPNSLTLNGKEIAEHTHSQGNDSDGDSQQDTGPNL